MNGENLLAADAVAQAADGDGLLNAAMLAGNDRSLEHLHSLTSAFLDFHMNANGVADIHLRQFFLHVLAGQSLHQIHNVCPPHLLGVRASVDITAEDRPFTDLTSLPQNSAECKQNFRFFFGKRTGMRNVIFL